MTAAQEEAAAVLGRLDAEGLLPPGEAAATLRVIVNTAYAANPAADRRGIRCRLVWAARDARHARAMEIDRAANAVRWAVRPLFRIRASRRKITDAARDAAAGALPADTIEAILLGELRRATARRG